MSITSWTEIASFFEQDFKKADGRDRTMLLQVLKNRPDEIKDLILQLLPDVLEKIVIEKREATSMRVDNADRLANNVVAHLQRVFASEMNSI